MKKIITLIAFVFISTISFAQNGPKIEFSAKDNTIDYGKISKGSDSGVRVFEFTNTGNSPLIITDVLSTCGCTVPTKPKDPIMPGKKGKIEINIMLEEESSTLNEVVIVGVSMKKSDLTGAVVNVARIDGEALTLTFNLACGVTECATCLNQRCASAAYDFLLEQLRKWRAGDLHSAIPGYITPPPNASCSTKFNTPKWATT